jgi:flagellar basal-body rod modification protein FlgD
MPEALTGSTGSTPTTGFNSVTGASGAKPASTKPGGELDKDAFLKLLVAQLKYQNPMSPADPNEFLGQTAQFTMVEKLEQISKAQSDLTVWQKVTAGQSLVGREVTGKGDLGTDVTGVVTGLTLGTDGPRLLLADGSKMAVADVTAVSAAPTSATRTTTPGATPTPSTGASTPPATGSTTPATDGASAPTPTAGPAAVTSPTADPVAAPTPTVPTTPTGDDESSDKDGTAAGGV